MSQISASRLTLFGRDGRRKYLTPTERLRFIETATDWPNRRIGTLCLIMAYTGCRISEALALTSGSIDFDEMFVVFRSLKKRGDIIYRALPVPETIVRHIAFTHNLGATAASIRLWDFGRTHAWASIKQVMSAAGIIEGAHATPKGLRHGFGIHAVRSGVPLNLVRRWLGHANLATTAIYTEAIGQEERELASRMWEPNGTPSFDGSHPGVRQL